MTSFVKRDPVLLIQWLQTNYVAFIIFLILLYFCIQEIIPEIQESLTQCENCFQLLLPKMTFDDLDEDVSMATSSTQFQSKKTPKPLPEQKHEERKLVNKRPQSEAEKDADRTKDGSAHHSKTSQNFKHDSDRSSGENSSVLSSGKSIFDIGDEEDDTLEGDQPSCVSGEIKRDHRRTKEGEEDSHVECGSNLRVDGQESEEERRKGTSKADGTSESDEGEDDSDSNEMEDIVGEERRSLLQQHGLPSWTSININIDLGTGKYFT